MDQNIAQGRFTNWYKQFAKSWQAAWKIAQTRFPKYSVDLRLGERFERRAGCGSSTKQVLLIVEYLGFPQGAGVIIILKTIFPNISMFCLGGALNNSTQLKLGWQEGFVRSFLYKKTGHIFTVNLKPEARSCRLGQILATKSLIVQLTGVQTSRWSHQRPPGDQKAQSGNLQHSWWCKVSLVTGALKKFWFNINESTAGFGNSNLAQD